MPINLAEAQRRLAENPLSPDPEVRDVLVAAHGEARYKELRREAAHNVRVTTRQQPVTTAAPTTPQPGSADEVFARAEYELSTNPVGASAATRALMRAKLGDAEYARRVRAALHASGQLNMKVTPR